MWKETEIFPRAFRNIGYLEEGEISAVVRRLITECDASPFRQSLYRKRWDNLNKQNLQEWLDDLGTRINEAYGEYLAVYVKRVLRGELEPCGNNEDIGTVLSRKQSVWKLEFERLGRYCDAQGIR